MMWHLYLGISALLDTDLWHKLVGLSYISAASGHEKQARSIIIILEQNRNSKRWYCQPNCAHSDSEPTDCCSWRCYRNGGRPFPFKSWRLRRSRSLCRTWTLRRCKNNKNTALSGGIGKFFLGAIASPLQLLRNVAHYCISNNT